MQLLYGHDRDHVTKCVAMYIVHVIPLARARTQSLDYLRRHEMMIAWGRGCSVVGLRAICIKEATGNV